MTSLHVMPQVFQAPTAHYPEDTVHPLLHHPRTKFTRQCGHSRIALLSGDYNGRAQLAKQNNANLQTVATHSGLPHNHLLSVLGKALSMYSVPSFRRLVHLTTYFQTFLLAKPWHTTNSLVPRLTSSFRAWDRVAMQPRLVKICMQLTLCAYQLLDAYTSQMFKTL